MAKPFTPKVVTGNHLLDGDVIYLTAGGRWSRDLALAAVLTDAQSANRQLAVAESLADEVVGAYLADVSVESGATLPAHFREVFRTRGPSNYFHGRQAVHEQRGA